MILPWRHADSVRVTPLVIIWLVVLFLEQAREEIFLILTERSSPRASLPTLSRLWKPLFLPVLCHRKLWFPSLLYQRILPPAPPFPERQKIADVVLLRKCRKSEHQDRQPGKQKTRRRCRN